MLVLGLLDLTAAASAAANTLTFSLQNKWVPYGEGKSEYLIQLVRKRPLPPPPVVLVHDILQPFEVNAYGIGTQYQYSIGIKISISINISARNRIRTCTCISINISMILNISTHINFYIGISIGSGSNINNIASRTPAALLQTFLI